MSTAYYEAPWLLSPRHNTVGSQEGRESKAKRGSTHSSRDHAFFVIFNEPRPTSLAEMAVRYQQTREQQEDAATTTTREGWSETYTTSRNSYGVRF